MSDDEHDAGAGVLATPDPAAVPGADAAAAAAPVAMAGLAGMDPAAYAQWVQALQAQQVAAQQMYLQQIAAAAGAAGGGVLLWYKFLLPQDFFWNSLKQLISGLLGHHLCPPICRESQDEIWFCFPNPLYPLNNNLCATEVCFAAGRWFICSSTNRRSSTGGGAAPCGVALGWCRSGGCA